MALRRLTAAPLLLAGVLSVAIALVGCSTPTPSGGTGGNGGSGGTNGRPGTSQDDPGSGSEDTEETVQPLGGRLPSDWPADVEVPDGEIVQSLSMGGSWLALINVADTAAAFASSSASLQAAGYAALSEVVTDNGSVGVYENTERQVQIAVASSSDAGWTMSYTITEKG
jgi:hypothetical protein